MSSKPKKGKKKAKTSDTLKSKDFQCNKKIYTYFSNEEIAEIKSTLKIKDVTGVPYIIAATFLQKFDLLKELLADGYNINQTGQNNMTALIWAVKYKYLEIIDYLLANGADPTIKTDGGDNVLIIALENKLWDEQAFMNLWKSVKKISFIDVNFTNKNGHNMLHMCVRRDWEELLKILLTEKPNIDAANSNGVTPLMLACFRTNFNIVNILIEAGADILKEDNHGRMTLCYAISSSLKLLKPPFLVIDKIVTELKQKSSLETYFKKRIQLIISTAKKPEISCATSAMLIKIVQYAIHYVEDGINMFLREQIFQKLIKAAEICLENLEAIKFILEISIEILSYNEQSLGFNQEFYNKSLIDFFESDLAELCFEVISKNNDLAKIAFNLLLLSYTNEDHWCKLLQENHAIILPFFNGTQILPVDDSNRMKILKNRKRKLKKLLENLDICTNAPMDTSEDKKKAENLTNYSKRSRRRSRAIKAKLTKIKSAELSKRLNLNGKKSQKPDITVDAKESCTQQTIKECGTITDITLSPPTCSNQITNPEANDFKYQDHFSPYNFSKLKQKVFINSSLLPSSVNVDANKLFDSMDHLKGASKFDRNVNHSLNSIIDYLKQLVQLLIRKYQEYWQKEHSQGVCYCSDESQHKPWLLLHHLKTVEIREQEIIEGLQRKFDELFKNIRELACKSLSECVKAITRVEALILNYEIRGVKLLSYVSSLENLRLIYSTDNPKWQQNPNLVTEHVQNVINGLEESQRDLDVDVVKVEDEMIVEYQNDYGFDLYSYEMSLVRDVPEKNKRKEIESKLNTIANGFHLINSIMSICEDFDDDPKNHQRSYGISDLNHPLRRKYQKNLQYPEVSEYMPKRLKSQIASLQNLKSYQRLLGNEIRISTKEQRVNYIISVGINFNAVELGLDINNQPLAVKRIQRESWVGKIIKNLIEPLLGVIDSHVLHYFACEYEGNELILATPLCKWNMAQYVQILRQSNDTTMPGLTAMQVVKQFLEGLVVLHKCELPIVHGNLKPSNIFIDFNGMVKIAEFGIHKALYKIIEAPQSSLIWFAKETLDIYRNSSIVECSIKSDIQVAGMLLYFILTYGKHPFGDDIDEILRNIHRGIPKLNCRNVDLRDLLLWMMLNDFNGRPCIDQVLSHPFFWSTAKKWSFIRSCSGINQTGYLMPINVEKLHRSIDSFADAYIKIDWQEVVKNKHPNIKTNDIKNISGLLKFIKYCDEHQLENNLDDVELSCSILTLFPTLAVALFRILQNTNWLKHGIFMPFSLAGSGVF